MAIIVYKPKFDVFPNETPERFSLQPRITSVSEWYDPGQEKNIKQIELELYCVVDQRKIIEGSVKSVKMFLSKNSLDFYNLSLINDAI